MTKIKMGIIGYGNMGTSHVKNIMEGKVPGMTLGAVCDSDETRLAALKKIYPDIPTFTDVEEMYKSGCIDSVLVAVPHYDHPRYAVLGFQYGLNVLIEKPAGVYTKQVEEMNEAARVSGKVFGIMYNQRTKPIYQKVKQMVESGQLGHIKRICWTITHWYRPQAYHDSSTWRSTWKTEGGGALINQNPHQLDLWQWMFGMPDKIYSRVSYGKYYDIEVEDDVVALFEYENGTTGQYITSTGEAPGTNRLEIACDMGKLVVDENDNLTFYRNTVSEREHNQQNTLPFKKPECWKCEVPVKGKGEEHVGILKNFADAVLNGAPLLAKGEEGILGLTISNAIHLSSWTGEMVDVKDFPSQRFYELLQERIAASTVVKQEKNLVVDISKTH